MVPLNASTVVQDTAKAMHPPYADWNSAKAEFPDACVHELFEQQVARTPDAVALVFGDQQISYRQLNEQANRVANYLLRFGFGADTLVGVCLERSPNMMAALFGVWKAGAAYVPLDSSYPPDRLMFMVRDADLRILLTEEKSRRLFAESTATLICLDSDWPVIARESGASPKSAATPDHLAYVMYTSGSTGAPKGVMIVQRGLVNYLCWAIGAYRLDAGGSVPVHSSISFDLTVTSLYPSLLVGGQIELVPEDLAAQHLVAALRRGKNYGAVKITPAHLELLSQQLSPEELAIASQVFVIGGENLLAESLRPWRTHAPATRLINEYGPTETVVGCCIYEVAATDPENGSVPVGRPIANTQLYVLDADLRPLPVGETGELYIGGAGVARGYLNRPQLTQERFLEDPFSGVSGARMYKSGDLARFRPDGILEYLGRIDSQVKIRGYRIELGEIEANLAAHAEVRSCVVLAPEASPGVRQLVAYVIRKGDTAAADGGALQRFMKQRLPEFMVPAKVVFLEAFPLTKNGKVDRQALLEQSAEEDRPARPIDVPQTPVEEKIAAIWQAVLRLEHIGINDDVFDLGARSLQAVKVVAQIRTVFDVDLQLRNLFENPTVAGLARVVDELLWLAQPKPANRRVSEFEEIEL